MQLLERVIPFQFLSAAERQQLADVLVEKRYAPGEILLQQGEQSRQLFLLAEGQVAFYRQDAPEQVLAVATAGQLFGEQASLFDQPRRLSARADGPALAYVLEGDVFLQLISGSTVFAQALGNALRDKHGIFARYEHIYARILALLDQRAFLLSELVPAYRQLLPALHPHLADDVIDVSVSRLTRNFGAIFLPRLTDAVTVDVDSCE